MLFFGTRWIWEKQSWNLWEGAGQSGRCAMGNSFALRRFFFFIYVPARIWKKSTSGSVGRLITLKRKPDVLQMERG